MKNVLVLAGEITGLLLVFLLILLILGYFKIITLPNFLPNTPTSTTKSVNLGTVNNTQTSVPVNFAKLTNQAPDAQIQKYQNRAAGFSKPTAQANPNDYISDAILSGFDNQTIQVVTKDGVLNLSFNAATLFQKYPRTANANNIGTKSAGAILKPIQYTTSGDFFKDAVLGSVLQVFFSKPNLRATQVNYVESVQPIL